MKISLNWLREYLDITLPVNVIDIVDGMTNLGIEVESVENQAETLKNFVIGKVLERTKHPNADKLSVCKVDAGTGEILNIVCGAPNVDSGQTVCVALVGAVVPNGEFEIKKAKLRGEVSEGMICSAKELNLGDDHTGIMVLDTDLPIGTPFSDYLKKNDVVFETGITPNRGDLLSHFGIARELGTLINRKISEPKLGIDIKINGNELKGRIEVVLENPNACKRYCGILVEGIKVGESPIWLKDRLTAVGLRPINNIVDITNFVMMECGQPLHAFDYDRIAGKKIIVKDADAVNEFITLDSKKRKLRRDVLLICDADKPVALAGIMGGENSEISNSTTSVFIESAYFDPVITRKSSKYLGLQTDSSYRFERGVDIDKTEWACKRAAQMIAEISSGNIVNGFIDEYPVKFEKLKVPLRVSQLGKIAGATYTGDQAVNLLEKIDVMKTGEENGELVFEIPQARREDLCREIDLIEEVIRIDGYDKIGIPEYDNISLDVNDYYNKEYDYISNIKNYLVGRGFHGVVTNTLVDQKLTSAFGDDFLSLINPSSDQMTVLRSNLFLSHLEVIRLNFDNMNNSLKLFEVGNTFKYGKDGKIGENKSFLMTLAGYYDLESSDIKPRYFDLLDIKGELKGLLEKLHIDIYNINYYNYTGNFEFQLIYEAKGNPVAVISKFSEKFLKKLNIEMPVFVCEIPSLV
jgi:phenylalanyl-tRNA synthetase beta chain